ncbi:MAG: HDOD domain-containing protein [Planctomycetota bacterium]|nr:MAG: HDOD domain-containing protein [Planctomycetota bacterium]
MKKRVLFVDDEPRVLEGLRNRLRKQRKKWDMVFAEGGERALEELARAPCDVVVSDMRMPGMDGATLLARVQEEHPDAVRIVLSGYAELEAAVRAVRVAHQFLSKPCEAEVLVSTVERACNLQALLGEERIRQVVGRMASLPPLPEAYAELSRVLADEDAGIKDVARVVEGDVALSAKLLQLVNSAFFRRNRRITSIEQAAAHLGIMTLRNLVLQVEVFERREVPAVPGFSAEDLQRHSLLVGGLAAKIVPAQRDDAFLAGMLHDVGKLVLACELPETFAADLAACPPGGSLAAVEVERHGVGHAEVGGYLLGLWGLPYTVVEAVANHHHPGRVPEHHALDVLGAVHVANALAHEVAGGAPADARLDTDYLERHGLAGDLARWREVAAELEELL